MSWFPGTATICCWVSPSASRRRLKLPERSTAHVVIPVAPRDEIAGHNQDGYVVRQPHPLEVGDDAFSQGTAAVTDFGAFSLCQEPVIGAKVQIREMQDARPARGVSCAGKVLGRICTLRPPFASWFVRQHLVSDLAVVRDLLDACEAKEPLNLTDVAPIVLGHFLRIDLCAPCREALACGSEHAACGAINKQHLQRPVRHVACRVIRSAGLKVKVIKLDAHGFSATTGDGDTEAAEGENEPNDFDVVPPKPAPKRGKQK